MEKYHITVTDNETGKELQSTYTNAFIMATYRKIDDDKNITEVSKAFYEISPMVLAKMILLLSNLAERLIEEHPNIKPLLGLMQKRAKEE